MSGPVKKKTQHRPTRGVKMEGCRSVRGLGEKKTQHRPTRGVKREGCPSMRGLVK